ncbi:response regulator transcription factor [Sulfurimonas sp. HSL-1716]|uniref:response regulator transcription factor n=1 Tax=Hydrocurvibacter sulfurireducens TaxID=3131937 RepID=UPI0031F78F7E
MKIEDITILIAEDEEELRNYLAEYLQIFFKYVYVAKCGHSAYMLYLEKHPDIIITDINMPNLDGLNMISRIRKSDSETKIIIMSAHSEQEKLLHAVELHLVTYLIKPIQNEVLKKFLFDIVDTIRNRSERIYLGDDFFWNKKDATLWHNSEQISLKERESMLLSILCSRINHAFSSESIFYKLYAQQSDKEFSQDAITSLVKRLRQKLPKNIIQNEYGLGYKIVIKK